MRIEPLAMVVALLFAAASCIGSSIEGLGPEDDGPIAVDPEEDDGEGSESLIIGAQGCSFVPKVIVYSPGYNSLALEIAAKMDAYQARCAQYHFMLPAVQDELGDYVRDLVTSGSASRSEPRHARTSVRGVPTRRPA